MTKYLLNLIRVPLEIGKNELMNEPSTMIPVLSDNKAHKCDKLVITEVGSRTFSIPPEGSNSSDN